MKKIVRKTIATVAAVSMMLPMVASCGKKSSGNGVVADDTPWYNATIVHLDEGINMDEYDYYQVAYIATYGDKLVFHVSGMKKVPQGFDLTNGDLSSLMVDEIAVYDSDGNKLSTTDVQTSVREGVGERAVVNSVVQGTEGIVVTAIDYDRDFNAVGQYRAEIDIESGSIGEFAEYANEYDDELRAIGATPEAVRACCGYLITPYWIYDEAGSNNSYVLLVAAPDGSVSKIDLRESLPGVTIYGVSQLIDLGENKALGVLSTDSEDLFVDIDFGNMTVTQSTQDYSWANLSAYDLKCNEIDGYGLVVSDDESLSRVNFETNTVDTILNYENSNINRADAKSLTPIAVSDTRVVLTGTLFRIEFSGYRDENVLVFLDKADTNPHAGKTILTVAPLSGYTYPLCQSVINFNDSSENYFATFDTRYDIDDYMSANNDPNADYDAAQDQAQTNLGNQLTIDLMGGNGPDVIVDGFSYSQLNNPDYLLDLSEYVNSELTAENYYRNVIDIGFVGDGIYQIPVTCKLQGIVTDASNVEEGQIGFTYEQYETFVDTVCNGTDPIQGGRVEFFITSINSMMDLMVDDNGNFNFDNEAFRALAEYTRDYINENSSIDEMGQSSSQDASVSYINMIGSYFDDVGSSKVLLGFPSYDARGPLVTASVSVGVSSQSPNTEGGMEFVRYFMSDEAQTLFSTRNGIPLSRSAFDSVSTGHIEGHNATLETMRNYFSESELLEWGYNLEPADEATAQALSDMIDQLHGYNAANDGAVNAIIREEIPAFFEGQKTLDQVIQVLQDRAQTVVSERR